MWRCDGKRRNQGLTSTVAMDADNRVVINCGGIRHEVYKVEETNYLQNIFLVFFSINCKMFKFLCPSVNESSYNCNHLSVSLTTQSVFPSEFKATQLTFPTLRHFVLKWYKWSNAIKQKVTEAKTFKRMWRRKPFTLL